MASAPPPTYEQATGSSTATSGAPNTGDTSNSSAQHLRVRNGIPPSSRRSMEDEARPLPTGWVRSFDPHQSHQFFVDTTQDPPRAIWQHPYDDEAYVNSLPEQEREKLAGQGLLLNHTVSKDDIVAESTDEEGDDGGGGRGPSNYHAAAVQGGGAQAGSLKRIGRKLKDSVTSTTHAEREAQRQRRAQDEEAAYRQHVAFRRGLAEAIRTGKPQLLGNDESGREVYLEPPGVRYSGVVDEQRLSSSVTEVFYSPGSGPEVGGPGARFVKTDGIYPGGAYGGALGGRGVYPGGRGLGTLGYGPFMRPYGPYRRPYGYGYGGGFGLPLMAPLMGGMMLGGLMF